MRRIAKGCRSESHVHYGTFMGSLSSCIFEWDAMDYEKLMEAKKGQLMNAGVRNPSASAIRKAVSREELARHCRRRTRGTTETVGLIEALILAMSQSEDALGNKLFNDNIQDIWSEQKKHIKCIQDPPGIHLPSPCTLFIKVCM